MSDTRAVDAQDVLAQANESPLMAQLGILIGEATDQNVLATMPVRGNTQPFGSLHGGATAALCESVASVGALLACAGNEVPVGVELSINHLRSATSGVVTATATPLHQGRSTAVWDVQVHDESGSLIAVSRVTLVLRSQ